MKILGLDPSTKSIGHALLRADTGCILDSGVYHPVGDSFDEKLVAVYYWLIKLLDNAPAVKITAVEMPFVGMNANTHYKLSALSGVLRAASCRNGIATIPVVPTARCRAVGLKGNASKKEILARVNEIYNLDIDNFDESDAIAIALTGRNKYLDDLSKLHEKG